MHACSTKSSILRRSSNIEQNHIESNLLFRWKVKQAPAFVSSHQISSRPRVFLRQDTIRNHMNPDASDCYSPFESRAAKLISSSQLATAPTIQTPLNKHVSSSSLKETEKILEHDHESRRSLRKSLERYVNQVGNDFQLNTHLLNFKTLDWKKLKHEEFLSITIDSKTSAVAFQLFLIKSPLPQEVIDLVKITAEILIWDRFGCHILRRVIVKSARIRTLLANLSLSQFIDMATNEFSSRVMQVLASEDLEYSKKCISLFCENWKKVVVHASSNYLLSVCLKMISNNSKEFLSVGQALLDRCSTLIESKYDKRILLVYLENCADNDIETFYNILKFRYHFKQRCEDKYMVYIFRTLLRRHHKPSLDILFRNLKDNLQDLLKTKYFRMLLTEIFTEKRVFFDLQMNIIEILMHSLIDVLGLSTPTIKHLHKDLTEACIEAKSWLKVGQIRTYIAESLAHDVETRQSSSSPAKQLLDLLDNLIGFQH